MKFNTNIYGNEIHCITNYVLFTGQFFTSKSGCRFKKLAGRSTHVRDKTMPGFRGVLSRLHTNRFTVSERKKNDVFLYVSGKN